MSVRFSRRQVLGMSAAASVAAIGKPAVSFAAGALPKPKTGMGIVMYDCNLRRKWMRKQTPSFNLFEPITFLKHCHSLGAGGMQASLGVMKPQAAAFLKEYARANGMFIEAIIKPPKTDSDLERFEAEVKTARDVGAKAARTVIIPGRRYEYFKSYADFREAARRGHEMVKRAVPVVERHQVPLAIENHKDERIEERVALIEKISSPYVGTCVDTGNSFALLDDPYGAIEALAPFAFSVHFKDQALDAYHDGFLLGDVPLGQGSFDLKRMARTIHASKPKLQFCLEIITRDALKVPCLTDQYWNVVTEPTGRELARILRFVQARKANSQNISSRSLDEQVKIEDANVLSSLEFAVKELDV